MTIAPLSPWEAAARLFEPQRPAPTKPRPVWNTAGDLAKAIEPATVQTPALDLIDRELLDIAEGRNDRLILSLPPQEGKSTRVTTIGPLWMLTRDPDQRIAIVSYGQDLAEEFGRNIRNHITSNSGDEGTLDLGLRIAPDNGAARRFRIDQHIGGVRCVGLAGGLTGRPADALFIDDPISNREQADSPTFRQRAWNFWQAVGSTRLAPGAPVVLVLTRWHEDDLAARLVDAEDGHRWRVINIPALADHRPEKGEADPLGREPGEWLESARRRTPEQWQQIRVSKDSRTWTALYQGRPAPAEGDLFKRDEWRYYDQPIAIERRDGSMWVPGDPDEIELIQSWDMAFKDTKGSDYVCGQVWLRRGIQAYLLDQVHGRFSFTATCQKMRQLTARWPQAILKLVEDKANGTAVINALSQTVPGIVPEEPHGSKYARASAVTPFVEAKNVLLPAPELAPWVGDLIEECAAFPNSAHDDRVDTMSQALNRLLLAPLLAEQDVVEDEEFDDLNISTI